MADANMSYVYTIGGYATLIGLGYALYHVSTQKGNHRRGAPAPSVAKTAKTLHEEPRKEDRKKKQRMKSFASDAQESAKAKTRAFKAPEELGGPRLQTVGDDTSDDGVDNREFARQLAKAQEGTRIASQVDGPKQREKSVKQSRASQMSDLVAAQDKSSAPSSTTGADDDDDQSPAPSPEARPADVSGVSDMLEVQAQAGPSTLRITDMEPKQQKPKAAKAPEKTETKKQRQNRKKAEAAKAAREAAEKERKVLEEKQRRTARVAEGRAAKDGSQFQAANGASAAWTNGGNKASGASLVHQPLDTFERPATTTAKPPATVKSDSSWMTSLPSEEEQMEMLKDEADEWSTVKTKASKKAAPRKASSVSSADDKVQTQPQPATQSKQAVTSTSTSSMAKPAKGTPGQNFGGSFSALTTNDDGADDVEEEEWDV